MSNLSKAAPSKNEAIKLASRALRGGIVEGLGIVSSGSLHEDDNQLTKFHGIYQQDDRDLRPERGRKRMERAYSFMARLRIPGGRLLPAQWLQLAEIARERGNGTVKITTRQTVQFHGIIKGNLKPAIAAVNTALLDTIAACGDVNRNVICTSNPHVSPAHAEALELAHSISGYLLPKSRAWHEIWIDDEQVSGHEIEEEPLYGKTYLPRKFKIAIAVPPQNDVDVFAHDLGLIAIVEGGVVQGYNVSVGGGMGMTHGETDTFPRTGTVIGFCTKGQVVAVSEAAVEVQRDEGDRSVRKHARLKYTIERMGVDAFRTEMERRLGFTLQSARAYQFESQGDRLGWYEDHQGGWHYGFFIENGRVHGPITEALHEISHIHGGEFILTANQSLIIAGVTAAERPALDEILSRHDVVRAASPLRRNSMACVALPTCGLALAESERYLPELVTTLDAILDEAGLSSEELVIRMTGCPNGCARPYMAEIALVGRGPGRYNLYLGGAFDGTRLNKLYRPDVNEAQVLALLTPLFQGWAAERAPGEHFSDWVIRAGHIQPTTAGNRFHLDLNEELRAA